MAKDMCNMRGTASYKKVVYLQMFPTQEITVPDAGNNKMKPRLPPPADKQRNLLLACVGGRTIETFLIIIQ